MKLPNGNEIKIKNLHKFAIDWDKPSRSKFQTNVKDFLKPYWRHHLVFEEIPVPKTRLSIDLFNYTLCVAIEVQGTQHLKYNKFFHGSTRYKFLQQLKRDQSKLKFCDDMGIKLVEIYPNDELSKELFKRFDVEL